MDNLETSIRQVVDLHVRPMLDLQLNEYGPFPVEKRIDEIVDDFIRAVQFGPVAPHPC